MRKWFTQQTSDSVAVRSPLVMAKRERNWKDSCKMLAVWTEVASQHFWRKREKQNCRKLWTLKNI